MTIKSLSYEEVFMNGKLNPKELLLGLCYIMKLYRLRHIPITVYSLQLTLKHLSMIVTDEEVEAILQELITKSVLLIDESRTTYSIGREDWFNRFIADIEKC